MAELLTMLRQLQTRFAPFLDRYHNFMQEDPEIPTDVSFSQNLLKQQCIQLIFILESKTDPINVEPRVRSHAFSGTRLPFTK